jgi:hypothetical protein
MVTWIAALLAATRKAALKDMMTQIAQGFSSTKYALTLSGLFQVLFLLCCIFMLNRA